jgi:hypothetical protein
MTYRGTAPGDVVLVWRVRRPCAAPAMQPFVRNITVGSDATLPALGRHNGSVVPAGRDLVLLRVGCSARLPREQ